MTTKPQSNKVAISFPYLSQSFDLVQISTAQYQDSGA